MAMKLSELSIKGIHGTMNTICAVTDGNCIIGVTAVSDEMLNIWMDYDGKKVSNNLHRSEERIKGNGTIFFTDMGEYYFISAGKAALRLYKNHIRIMYVTKDNGRQMNI